MPAYSLSLFILIEENIDWKLESQRMPATSKVCYRSNFTSLVVKVVLYLGQMSCLDISLRFGNDGFSTSPNMGNYLKSMTFAYNETILLSSP